MNPRCVSVSTNRRCSAKSSPRPRNVRCELAVVFKPASHRYRAGGEGDDACVVSFQTCEPPAQGRWGFIRISNLQATGAGSVVLTTANPKQSMASFTNRRKNNFRTANWPVVTTIFVIYCCGISLSIAEPIDFARHVRPILSDACFECHGPDAKQREAELRLDTEAGLFRTQDEVTVVVPGDPAASELIRRITSQEEHDRMPPQGAKRQLTPKDVEQLLAVGDQHDIVRDGFQG